MRRTLCPILLVALIGLTGCSFLSSVSSSRPPTAVLVADPMAGRAPLHVLFDASRSFGDRTIVAYLWEVVPAAEVEAAEGARFERTFETAGEHTVRLTVTDASGRTGTAEITIAVENTAPIASCRFSTDSPVIGEWVLFDASASYDPDGRLVDFVWEFGDGNSARGTRVGHAYEEIGVYSVRLTVEDDRGAATSIVHLFTVHLGGAGGGCGGGGVCLRQS